jgi:hypothetical protein
MTGYMLLSGVIASRTGGFGIESGTGSLSHRLRDRYSDQPLQRIALRDATLSGDLKGARRVTARTISGGRIARFRRDIARRS